MGRKIYLIGSLKNTRIPVVAKTLRDRGHEVFDDWFGAGPEADQIWRDYEKQRGRSYVEALFEKNATKNFNFDHHHLKAADTGILLLPAGKSGHLELGYMAGLGKNTHILVEGNMEIWDLMYRLANMVHFDLLKMVRALEI